MYSFLIFLTVECLLSDSIIAKISPTGTSIPDSTNISFMIPEFCDSISITALSVSTSINFSPSRTESPMFLNHLYITPVS